MTTFTVVMAAAITGAKDLLRLSPLAAQTNKFLPPVARLEIVSIRVTTDTTNQQLAIGLYKASTLGTGTDLIASVVDVEGGTQTFPGTVVGNLTVDTAKSATLDRQGTSTGYGYVWDRNDEEDHIDVLGGENFVVRLENAPTAASAFSVKVVFRTV